MAKNSIDGEGREEKRKASFKEAVLGRSDDDDITNIEEEEDDVVLDDDMIEEEGDDPCFSMGMT